MSWRGPASPLPAEINPRAAFAPRGLFGILAPSSGALYVLGAAGTLPWAYGRWWTLFTAIYLHGNLLHILFNMMWVRQLAPPVEELFGRARLIVIFTVAGEELGGERGWLGSAQLALLGHQQQEPANHYRAHASPDGDVWAYVVCAPRNLTLMRLKIFLAPLRPARRQFHRLPHPLPLDDVSRLLDEDLRAEHGLSLQEYLALATVSPAGLKVISKTSLMKNLAWTVPTLVGTKLYVRDRRTIVALDLS